MRRLDTPCRCNSREDVFYARREDRARSLVAVQKARKKLFPFSPFQYHPHVHIFHGPLANPFLSCCLGQCPTQVSLPRGLAHSTSAEPPNPLLRSSLDRGPRLLSHDEIVSVSGCVEIAPVASVFASGRALSFPEGLPSVLNFSSPSIAIHNMDTA
ncbi:uncharacterized protein K460DRAFT_40407 [Cucurbitaria berberidis CBS 394.84]|uniref:Uncharacterized protein n=1 Tax=Cucurbitaria berberidis CBS 394.84 TaxID=1168544 RepID=A0A9P4GUV3_9PLEO|nr:uncharacterized protein K460DRAFT_40407 [Cucurbitaria berberidis CBS 394.84]KAF1851742.1 hypothetical protein K460DRAFT_40407 [Cucurbitaria berberidis CBS 394.84]